MTEPCIFMETCGWKSNLIISVIWFLLCIPGAMYLYAVYASWKERYISWRKQNDRRMLRPRW